MKKRSSALVKLAILAIAFIAQANTVASVLLGDIAQSFPEASMTSVQMVMTLGMIGAFPITLSVGFLTSKFRKKSMVLLGLIMIAAGGIIPVFIQGSLMVLYISALIVGAGQGFLLPLVGTLIIELFTGEEQHKMLGFHTSAMNVGNVTLLLLAGVLAPKNWVNVYFLYLLAIPVFLIVSAFLPKGELQEPETDESGESSAKVPTLVYITCFINFLFFIGYITFPTGIGIFIAETGLGDAGTTSLIMTLNTAFGIVVGLVFAEIVKRAKLYVAGVAGLFSILGFYLIYTANSVPVIYVGAALLGMTFGLINSAGGYILSRITTPEQLAPSFSISMTFITAGVIASPIVVNAITGIWAGNNPNPKNIFLTALGIITIMTIVQFIWGKYLTQHAYPEEAPEVASGERT